VPQVITGGERGWFTCQPDCCPNPFDPDRPALCSATPAGTSAAGRGDNQISRLFVPM